MDTGILFLRILSPFYVVVATKLVADGILRGAGLMKQFTIATFVDLLLRVILAKCFSITALGSTGIWCAWPVGWFIGTMLSVLFFRSAAKQWKKLSHMQEEPALPLSE